MLCQDLWLLVLLLLVFRAHPTHSAKSNLFEPARKSAVQIQPVALLYFQHAMRSDVAAFVGEQTLINSLWQVLSAQGLSIELHFLAPIMQADAVEAPPRAELGRLARHAIAEVVAQKSA